MPTNLMGKWVSAGGYWSWTPYKAGGDDPSLPPPGVVFTEGPMYHGGITPPGGDFSSWVVIGPNGKTLQQIINWKSGPDAANPYADWYKKQGK